jgi:hypothetical protein
MAFFLSRIIGMHFQILRLAVYDGSFWNVLLALLGFSFPISLYILMLGVASYVDLAVFQDEIRLIQHSPFWSVF